MGSIAGLINKHGRNVSEQIVQMLSIMKHRGPDSAGVLIDGETRVGKDPEHLDVSNVKGKLAVGHTHLTITTGEEADQPLTGCLGKLTLVNDGEIYTHQEIRDQLTGHHFLTEASSEVIIHLVEEKYSRSLMEAVKASLSHLYGVYAFAIASGNEIVVARDPVGVKPLYLGENDELVAFASERKALWKIGIKTAHPLLPGYLASLTNGGCFSSPALTLVKPQLEEVDMETAAMRLKEALYKAFEAHIKKIGRLGIAFSGGLDSSLAAKIVSDLGGKAIAYTAGLEGAPDVNAAREVRSYLDCELHTRILTVNDVETYIPKVIYGIEEADVMKVATGLPLYAVAEMAHSEGIKVILSGQGSDELFGGYARYLNILRQGGYQQLHENLWNDLVAIHRVSLQRDDAVAMANSVELRVPYLDVNVIKTAMSIPPSFKISGPEDTLKKRVLRRVAKMIGLPANIVDRPKKAIQYGSGVDKVVKTLAKKSNKPVEKYLKDIYTETFKDMY